MNRTTLEKSVQLTIYYRNEMTILIRFKFVIYLVELYNMTNKTLDPN